MHDMRLSSCSELKTEQVPGSELKAARPEKKKCCSFGVLRLTESALNLDYKTIFHVKVNYNNSKKNSHLFSSYETPVSILRFHDY